MATEARSYMTVRQTAERYTAFTERGLRWLIFNRESNGLDSVVKKAGKKVLIDEVAFVAWIEHGAVPDQGAKVAK